MNERIEKLAEHLERYATFGRGDRSHEAAGLLREQHAEIERLREANEALRRDAELGRWIREETPPIEEIAARVDGMEEAE